jgi:threonylcarbamoyladenosine tRNA methylthiotransferase MtaB
MKKNETRIRKNVYLTYLGCRLNESEIEELAWRFTAHGQRVVRDPAEADLHVVNTCTVTEEAGRKSRQLIRRLARLNPEAQIAVTGCHATVAPEEVRRLPNVTWIVHNADKERLADVVVGVEPPDQDPSMRHLAPGALGRTRAFVKVQDGCDNRCTFCITTLARGRGRSRSLDQTVAEVQCLVAAGYQEVVLTGAHLGSYGRDRAEPDGLRHLVETLLAETDIPRLRLSSLEPWDLSPDFFELWADSRMCRQLHLPLQSGCDAVLRRMARRTTTADFAELVAAARDCIPDLALTTDVLVGFPGETDAAFEESYRFVEALGFARLHVFPFSPRPGTAAERMPDQVPADEKMARSRALRRLGAEQQRAFNQRYLGRTLPVLWEMSNDGSLWRGYTDNYLVVTTTSKVPLANHITPTRLVEPLGQGLRGEVVFAANALLLPCQSLGYNGE